MTEEQFVIYRDGRYKEQLGYYDNHAIMYKWLYHVCSIYVIVVSLGIVPILAIDFSKWFPNWDGKFLALVLSPTVALVTSLTAHFKFHENWLSCRATWDSLRHEVYFRDAKIGEYKDVEDVNALFVERVETSIQSEGKEWFTRCSHKEQVGNERSKKA